MKKITIVFLLFFIQFFVKCLLFPEEPVVRFRHFTVNEGMSQNSVYAIAQDNREFLWVATMEGLNRYDGYTFKIYRHQPGDPGSLGVNITISLHCDADGMLWVGTFGGGVNRFDPKDEKFTRFKHDPSNPQSLGDDYVYSIYRDKSGILWFGTMFGLTRFNPRTREFSRLLYEQEQSLHAQSSISNAVSAICEDNNGNIWLANQARGLVKVDPLTLKTEHFFVEPGQSGAASGINTIKKILYPGGGNILWVGTAHEMRRFDLTAGRFIPPDDSDPLYKIQNELFILHTPDQGQTLWIGTKTLGLYKYNTIDKTISHYHFDNKRNDSLNANYVVSITTDRRGILWVGTMHGLNKYNYQQHRFNHRRLFADEPGTENYSRNVFSILKARDGMVWVGTDNGMYRWNRHANRYGKLEFSEEVPNHSIYHMSEDSKGYIWVSVNSNRLCRIDPASLEPHPVPLRVREKDGEWRDIDSIYGSYPDPDGYVWICTNIGLVRIDLSNDSRKIYRNQKGAAAGDLIYNPLYTVFPGRGDNLWLAMEKGISRFDKKTGSFREWRREENNPNSLSVDSTRSIFEDETGTVWIGTWGGGLNRLDPESGKITHYFQSSGLPNSTIYAMFKDNSGYLWMSTNSGISRFDPQTGEFGNYDIRDGLQSNEFNANACFQSSDGELFFGGVNGVNHFYPRDIRDNPHRPPLVLTALKILNKPVETGVDSPLKQSITETRELVLSHRDYVFSLEFAALDFSIPSKNRYKYKLEGLDDHWIDLDTRHDVTFSTLPPGDYELKVTGCNNDGTWNEEGLSLKITVTPPFWRTWWFRGLALVIIVVFVLAWHRKSLLIQEIKLKNEASMSRLFEKFNLTNREQEIVLLVLKGKSNKNIEDELYLSINTIKSHLTRIYKKVGVKSRSELQSKFTKSIQID